MSNRPNRLGIEMTHGARGDRWQRQRALEQSLSTERMQLPCVVCIDDERHGEGAEVDVQAMRGMCSSVKSGRLFPPMTLPTMFEFTFPVHCLPCISLPSH
jgi:hypothetical protein